MAKCLQNREEYCGEEIAIERPDGKRLVAVAHANPIFDEATGKLLGAVNVLIDVTERKRVLEELHESDRRKTEFLAMLSHEIRNPLAPIRNGLQILRLSSHDERVDRALSIMERQFEQMVHLIDDLLDLSRISKGKIKIRRSQMDLTAAVQDALETTGPAIQARNHQLSVKLPAKPMFILGDRGRLAQVFANLLGNSAKYTPPSGHIWLTVEPQGSDVVVSVKDDGIGIPKDKLTAIFDIFTQLDVSSDRAAQGGLGIGLSLVKALVEMHGGRVEASSEGLGRGSEFIVRLPVVLSPQRWQAHAAEDSNGQHPSYRVLVVDDNKDSADSLALMLSIKGHEVLATYDGREALAVADEFHPQVVLLDIGLPKLNGYEVARQIRGQPWAENIVLIAQTGWGQEEDHNRSREAGFNFHLVKPVNPADLEKLLAGLLLTPRHLLITETTSNS